MQSNYISTSLSRLVGPVNPCVGEVKVYGRDGLWTRQRNAYVVTSVVAQRHHVNVTRLDVEQKCLGDDAGLVLRATQLHGERTRTHGTQRERTIEAEVTATVVVL